MDTFLSIEDQIILFTGCVLHVQTMKVILPSGKKVGRDAFNVMFGGYVFSLDLTNERTTPRAWIAFTQNEAFRPPTSG